MAYTEIYGPSITSWKDGRIQSVQARQREAWVLQSEGSSRKAVHRSTETIHCQNLGPKCNIFIFSYHSLEYLATETSTCLTDGLDLSLSRL